LFALNQKGGFVERLIIIVVLALIVAVWLGIISLDKILSAIDGIGKEFFELLFPW
jgi:hypothetical protein